MRGDLARPPLAATGTAVRGGAVAAFGPGAVLQSFNTWAFKREQPSDRALLLATVEQRMAKDLPISFVLYWGKGPRSAIAEPDRACMAFLDAMAERVSAVYSGGSCFTLCLTDTHATLNGHSQAVIDSYFGDIEQAARAHGMRSIRLSRVVAAYEALARASDPAADAERIPPAVVESLERCATKWYRGDGSAETGARRYLAMNMVERRAVEAMFPDSVFVTFNGSAYRDLFPRALPIFYMYSLKRGTSVKPWFMDADGTPLRDVDNGSV